MILLIIVLSIINNYLFSVTVWNKIPSVHEVQGHILLSGSSVLSDV